MVFKTKHFGIIAAAIILGVGLWALPSFAQMRHGGGGRAGGPNLFFLMRASQSHAGSKDPGTYVDAKQPAKFSADCQPAHAAPAAAQQCALFHRHGQP